MKPQGGQDRVHRQNKGRTKPHPLRFTPKKVGKPCRATRNPKIKWATELDAQMALANTNNKQGSNTLRDATTKKETRAYQCEHCNYWHTTSYRNYQPPPTPVKKASVPDGLLQAMRNRAS